MQTASSIYRQSRFTALFHILAETVSLNVSKESEYVKNQQISDIHQIIIFTCFGLKGRLPEPFRTKATVLENEMAVLVKDTRYQIELLFEHYVNETGADRTETVEYFMNLYARNWHHYFINYVTITLLPADEAQSAKNYDPDDTYFANMEFMVPIVRQTIEKMVNRPNALRLSEQDSADMCQVFFIYHLR